MASADPESVRRAAREILARPEFGSGDQQWWQRLLDSLQHPLTLLENALGWLLARILGSDSGSAMAWTTVGVAAAVLAWLIFRLTHNLGADGRTEIRLAPETNDTTEADLLRQAAQSAAMGQWREAIRFRYGACLVDLAHRGLVDKRPGKTTGEYLHEVEVRAPLISPAFQEITSIFEWVWYGGGIPDGAEYQSFEHLILSLRAAVAA